MFTVASSADSCFEVKVENAQQIKNLQLFGVVSRL